MKPPLGADLVIPALALGFAVYFFVSIADLAWEAKANGMVIGAHAGRCWSRSSSCASACACRAGEATCGFEPAVGAARRARASASAWCAVTVAFIATLQLARPDARPAARAVRRALDHGRARQAAARSCRSRVAARGLPAVRRRCSQSDIPHGPIESSCSLEPGSSCSASSRRSSACGGSSGRRSCSASWSASCPASARRTR